MTNLEVDPNADFNATNPRVLEPEVEPAVETKAPEKSQAKAVALNQQLQAQKGGLLVGGTLEEQFRLAKAYHLSGLMPKGLNSPEKVLVALQLCHELGLPPMTSIGKIMVVNGTPAIFGDLPVALAYRSGKMEAYTEAFEDKDGKPYASTCTVKRKGQDPITRRFTLDDAKNAGLFRNDIWAKYTKRMLQCRARAWALKDALADVLMGVAILEYDMDSLVENGEVVGNQDIAGELNQKFLDKKDG